MSFNNIKLNLGCGNDIRLGYINIDKQKTHPSVIIDDFIVLSGITNNSVEEIVANKILRYVPIPKLEAVIKLWVNKLQPDGRLFISDLDSNTIGISMAFDNIQINEMNKLIFGDETDCHISLYNLTVIKDVLKSNNMNIVQMGYNGYDFYIEAIKNV